MKKKWGFVTLLASEQHWRWIQAALIATIFTSLSKTISIKIHHCVFKFPLRTWINITIIFITDHLSPLLHSYEPDSQRKQAQSSMRAPSILLLSSEMKSTSASSISITFGTKEFAIATLAVHLSIMVITWATGKRLVTTRFVITGKTTLVELEFASFYFLSHVDYLYNEDTCLPSYRTHSSTLKSLIKMHFGASSPHLL